MFAAKVILSAITPLSDDFLYNLLFVSRSSWQEVAGSGFFTPWYFIMKAVTQLWLTLPFEHPALEKMIGFWHFTPDPSVILLLLMQKAPLLLFDAATAIMIWKVVARDYSALLAEQATILWLANPFVTLTTEMWGTWDIASTFFLLIAAAAFAKGRFLESGISQGLGIAVKMYPLLALPIFLVFLAKEKVGSRLRFISGAAGAYLAVGVTPMLFAEKGKPAISTLSQFSYFAGTVWGYALVSYDVQISILVIALVLFGLGYLALWEPKRSSIFEAVMCLYLLVFAFSHWFPQFLLHLIPFMTIYYVASGRKKLPFFLYMSSALVFVLINFAFYWTSYGHTLFFIPNYNPVLQHYSDLLLFIPGWPIELGTVNSIILTPIISIFVGVSLYYFIWIFIRNSNKEALNRLLKLNL